MRTCSDVQKHGKGAPVAVFDRVSICTASAFDVCPGYEETAAACLSLMSLSIIKITNASYVYKLLEIICAEHHKYLFDKKIEN